MGAWSISRTCVDVGVAMPYWDQAYVHNTTCRSYYYDNVGFFNEYIGYLDNSKDTYFKQIYDIEDKNGYRLCYFMG